MSEERDTVSTPGEVFETTPGEGAAADEAVGFEASDPEPADPEPADPEVEVLEDVDPEDPSVKAAEYLALAQRTKADFDNYRKRAARDAQAAQVRGIAKLAKALFPALDNLERAIQHAAEEDPLLAGIKLVQTDLQSALTRAGIEGFDPAGESFDPTLHEAVAQAPAEGVAPGIVVETYQQGYRLGDAVLRPARVLVAQ